MEVVVARLLSAKKQTLERWNPALRTISHMLTNVPGSSAYMQGVVTYSNTAKARVLELLLLSKTMEQ